EQIIARNMLVEVEDAIAGTIHIAGNPIKMDSVPESPTREKIPEIGEHNRLILTELLGMSEHEINQLHSEGVI
ncbi:MAG: CoA transferase, partial [Actinomycetota bacterium]|nr:CoA transferase [Actinomycetota bacterium]